MIEETNDQAPAAPVHYRCKVTTAGANKTYGESRHKKGRGAIVRLNEAAAKAAEAKGWVSLEGIA